MSNDNNSHNGADKTPLQLEQIEKETRAFICPSCGDHLQFRVALKVVSVAKSMTADEYNETFGTTPKPKVAPATVSATSGMTGEQKAAIAEKARLRRLVQFYTDTGTLSAFEEVVKEIMADKLPKSIGDFFLTYLKTTTQAMLIPQMALRRLINEFDDGQIEVFHAQGVGAIVSDGKLRAFIPMHLLRGEVIRVGGGSNHRLRTRATDEGLDRWIRTKHGYVYGNGALFNEMRKSAAGGFELTVR